MYLVDILLPLFLFAVFFKSKPTKNFYENNFSIENTNAIRGICAIWVVLHHISGTVDFVQSKVLFTGLAGQIPITVFFFLSGYAMTFQLDKKQDALNGFFKKRVLKIFMPLAVMAIVFFSYYRILVMQRANQISVGRQLLNSLIDLSHGYPLVLNSWFVVELILLYIIFYFSFKLTKKNKKRGLLVLFLSSGILMALLMGLFVLRGWPSTWFLSTLIFPLGSMYYIYKNFIDSYIKKRY
jgi:peptidoglycan/LPS O-acetylase OafA/YrhL